MNFSDKYIEAVERDMSSTGKPLSKEHLKQHDMEVAYIREFGQLMDEFGSRRDEEYARRMRELWLKYYPDDKVMTEYHTKTAKRGRELDDSHFDPEALVE